MHSRNSTAALSARGAALGLPASDRFLSLPIVITMTGVSRSSIYSWMGAERFPKPKKLGPRKVGWLASDVDAWIRSREAA